MGKPISDNLRLNNQFVRDYYVLVRKQHSMEFKAMNMLAFLLLIMLTVHGIEGKEDNVHPESAAPNCSNRCEGCNPCKPVLVTVPTPSESESPTGDYKHQKWMCTCGGKYYNP